MRFGDTSAIVPLVGGRTHEQGPGGATEGRPAGTQLLTFDERLRSAGLREGFDVPAIN